MFGLRHHQAEHPPAEVPASTATAILEQERREDQEEESGTQYSRITVHLPGGPKVFENAEDWETTEGLEIRFTVGNVLHTIGGGPYSIEDNA
jgi:hypothetical protein